MEQPGKVRQITKKEAENNTKRICKGDSCLMDGWSRFVFKDLSLHSYLSFMLTLGK